MKFRYNDRNKIDGKVEVTVLMNYFPQKKVMKSRSRLIIAVVAVLALIAALVTYLYVFRKTPENLMKVKTDYEITAHDLYSAFESDETNASTKFVGKILEVRGPVYGIEDTEWGQTIITFIDPFFGVTATIDSSMTMDQHKRIETLSKGDTIVIKGRCDGMLTDVRLVKCFLLGE